MAQQPEEELEPQPEVQGEEGLRPISLRPPPGHGDGASLRQVRDIYLSPVHGAHLRRGPVS